MKFMSEKWCHKLHSHTKFQFSMLNIFKQKIFHASTMELWREIYEFIYMPLLLPLPVHMCVKENDFFHKIIFRKEWKIFYRSGPLLRLDHTHSELDASSTLRFATHSRGRRSDLTTVWSSLCLALPLLLSYLLFYTYIQWTTGKREAISWHVEV